MRTATARDAALDSLARAVSTLLRPSRAAARAATYVHGVFSDSERKSMQAMLARVTDPITYQGFQHFITHAVWDADRIWRRLLEVLPERRGRVDHRRHELSQTGDAVGRRGAPVLWRARQDRQLPSRGDGRALDRRARVADRRAAVSPEGVAQRRRRRAVAQIPTGVGLPGEVASGADVDPPRARRGAADHRGPGGRRVRRRHRVPARAASLAAAVCRWRLAASHGVSRDAGRRTSRRVRASGRPRSQLVLVHDTRPIAVARLGAGACPRARGDG